jgi:hypothetical protein
VLTVHTLSGKDRKEWQTSTVKFDTAEDFKSFVASQKIWHMRPQGKVTGKADKKLRVVTSLAEAISASQQDNTYLLLNDPVDLLLQDVSVLKGGEKNRGTGLEQQTTKALVSDPSLLSQYGNLSVVNGGHPVVFQKGDFKFEVDGLVRNGRQLLLNEAKWTPQEGNVDELLATATRLKQVLRDPSGYTSEPEGALAELMGLEEVVPVLSGFCFSPSVKQKAASSEVRCVHTNGRGYAADP